MTSSAGHGGAAKGRERPRDVGIAARPVGVPEAGLPRLSQRVDRVRFSADVAEGAGGVVEHGCLVGPQHHREIGLADRVLGTVLLGVHAPEEDPRPRVFRHLPQVVLECLEEPEPDVAHGVRLSQRPERVHDGDVNVVVDSRGLDRLLGQSGHFLVFAGGEERPQQEVIRFFAVALARDRGAGQPLGVAEHPDAERNDDAGFFRKRNERIWGDQAVHRMVPARQALKTDDPPRF